MPIMEVLAINVGAGIAKGIIKLWLKDAFILEGGATGLIEFLKGASQDTLARREAARQFEAIGERIGQQLLPLLSIEGSELDDASREAIALEVASTLEQLDATLLSEEDLDPGRLSRRLLSTRPDATRLFGDAETSVYQRLVRESCTYIVDIASRLPQFTERSFAEILARENQLLAITNETLAEVRRIREGSKQQADLDAANFETEYRLAVGRNLDALQLFGADVSAASRRHRLSVAYVSLSMATGVPSGSGQWLADEGDLSETENEADGRSVTMSAEEVLASANRLIINGQAGSGKTTLLQWLAVHAASRSFERNLTTWNEVVPFFIRLRDCVQQHLPQPEAFPGLVAPSISGTMPNGWVHRQLRSGRAVILIDGVDEVPQGAREQVRVWLEDLVQTYPTCRIVVSSRPHAIEAGWLDSSGFASAELLDMQAPDITALLMRVDHEEGSRSE